MSRRQRKQKTLELWCLDSSIFTQKSKGEFSSGGTIQFIEDFGCNRWMQRSIVINDQDCASIDESTRLGHVRSIGDEALGCGHVARVKRRVDSSCSWDLHRAIVINRKVH